MAKEKNNYNEYYNEVEKSKQNRPHYVKRDSTKTSICPECSTTARNKIIEKDEKGTKIECFFCSHKFYAKGNCVVKT